MNNIFDIDTQYPVDSFPFTARNAIRELARNVQAPIDLVALCVLPVMATVIQDKVKVRLPIGGQPKPVSLFTLVVAVSGDRKTTVDNLVWHPVRENDDKVQKEFEQAMKRYRCEHRIWAAMEHRLIRQAMGDEDE